jgi:hypothetical protein
VITVVPEPMAAVLFTAGLVLFLPRFRRATDHHWA